MDIIDKTKQLIEKGAKIIIISKNGLKADITDELSPALIEYKILKDQYYNTLTENRTLQQKIEVLEYNLREKLTEKEVLELQLKRMIND